MTQLLTGFSDYLVSQNLARKPTVAGANHPLWIEPRNGTPAPGEGDTAVVKDAVLVMAAFLTGGVAPGAFEGFSRKDTVDLWFRAKSADIVFPLDAAIRKAIIGPLGNQTDWTMGGVYIVQSTAWRPLQRLGSDEQAYDFNCSYLFETLT